MRPDDGRRPAAPEDMRASDDDRDRVVDLLTAAVTDGRLTLEEYSERSGTALAARTIGDLTAVTSDLPRSPPSSAALSKEHGTERLTAFLGNESRKGRWVVPERLVARSVLGDCHIEMQNAVLRQRVTTVEATVRFGAVTITVPDGVDVRLSGRAVLGGKSSKLRRTRPDAPVIEVRCDVLCGTVTVRPPGRLEGLLG